MSESEPTHDQPVSMAQARSRGRARARAVARAAARPVSRQPLLLDDAAETRGRRSPSRLLLLLLASVMAHGVVASIRMIQGVDPDRVAKLTQGGPMRVRTLRREARKREREAERAREVEQAREQEAASKKRQKPRPKREVAVEVEDTSADEMATEGDPGGEGGAAGPLFGGTPMGGGASGGGVGGGYALGSGDGSGRPRRAGGGAEKAGEGGETQASTKRRKKKLDPNKPVTVTREMKAPKPLPGNRMPAYPKPLIDRGITGYVEIKIHVHKDGSVRGIKIVRVENSATKQAHQNKANALLKKTVVKAVSHWRYAPAEYKGQKISVWVRGRFPFKLKT